PPCLVVQSRNGGRSVRWTRQERGHRADRRCECDGDGNQAATLEDNCPILGEMNFRTLRTSAGGMGRLRFHMNVHQKNDSLTMTTSSACRAGSVCLPAMTAL